MGIGRDHARLVNAALYSLLKIHLAERRFDATNHQEKKTQIFRSQRLGDTVDGSEIRLSPVEVDSLSLYLQGF